jgi:hypothetical protein
LTYQNHEKWVKRYGFEEPDGAKRVAVIMAGNIPLVGFHDFLTVLLFGHTIEAKLSSDDKRLLPLIGEMLITLYPDFKERIHFVERIKNPEAVIATGSDNTARYFDYYFGKYPNVIRKNRTSIAVLKGDETKEELEKLGEDIFAYFGLGCRNVSKLYMPKNFNTDRIFEAIVGFNEVYNNNKYANNYDYHRAIFLLNKEPFLENGFAIMREHESLHTPISVIHYERYQNQDSISQTLQILKEEIQCVVGNTAGAVPFGKAQQPALWDYAHGVDTVAFLIGL